ncbi:MAG: helix-turn-helix transcriptional regulator [Lachnospiraceae bacterium]|nr:helix-turn-helix transcriptional regulator [Lachnospiraceae bacterium]
MADKLHITADHLGKIEKARKEISIDLLIDIVDYFDVSLDYLILGRKHQSDIIRENLTGIIQNLETLRSQLSPTGIAAVDGR